MIYCRWREIALGLLLVPVAFDQTDLSLSEAERRYASVPLPLRLSERSGATLSNVDPALLKESSTVTVEIRAERASQVESIGQLVRGLHGSVTANIENAVFADLPVAAIPEIARSAGVHSISRAPRFFPIPDPPAPVFKGVDIVRAVGVEALHREQITGDKVRIGVIDFGFLHHEKLDRPGKPVWVDAVKFNRSQRIEGAGAGSAHGTACLEIIRDLAPAALIYAAVVDGEPGQVKRAADWLVQQKVDIISFSAGLSVGPRDGRSEMDEFVNNVVRKNHVLWVNAAGNSGNSHWTGDAARRTKDGTIVTGKDNVDRLYIKALDPHMTATVTWDDWGRDPLAPITSQAIDAYLFGFASGKAVQIKEAPFHGGKLGPVNSFSFDARPGEIFALTIHARRVVGSLRVHVFVEGGHVSPAVAERSVVIPATALEVLAVGAVNLHTDSAEDFTGRGPTEDGRAKPDLSAHDDTQSLVYARGFSGTSASCAAVAGFAALVKQRWQELSGADLRRRVLQFVRAPRRMMTAGKMDPAYGAGIIDASLLSSNVRSITKAIEEPTAPPPPVGTVILPEALAGEISFQDLDKLVEHAAEARGLDASLTMDRAGTVPVVRYEEQMRLTLLCEKDCHFALLHRDGPGIWELMDTGRQQLGAGKAMDFPDGALIAQAPSGRERFLLIASKAPLARNALSARTMGEGLLPNGVAIAALDFEVRP